MNQTLAGEAPKINWLPPGHDEKADLAILIVGWNVKDLLVQNLEALQKSVGSIKIEVILIDNASQDGTTEEVRLRFPDVKIIANASNAGFALANVQGMIAMHARHCLLLNPDMRAEPDALQKTVEYLDSHPEVAVASGKLFTSEGKTFPSIRRFPDVCSQLAILLKLAKLFPSLTEHYLYKGFDYETEQPVDSVRGAYFAMNGKALERLGGLDTRYFIWFEEVDYCKNAASKGWKVMHVPSIRATDFFGKSFAQRKRYWKQQQFSRSMVQYFEKWHPWWQATLIGVARPFALLAAFVADVFQK